MLKPMANLIILYIILTPMWSWRPLTRPIHTLNHRRLRPHDWLTLADLAHAPVTVHHPSTHTIHLRYADPIKPRPRLAFPPHAAGFLYYHSDPAHPHCGELRLRTAPSPTCSFFSGSDLLLPDGRPWCLTLSSLASVRLHRPLAHLLLADTLVSPALLAHVSALDPRPARLGAQTLRPGARELHMDLARRDQTVYVAGAARFWRVWVRNPMVEMRCTVVEPRYHGACALFRVCLRHAWFDRVAGFLRCGLELAKEREALCIRVLEVVTPVELVDRDYKVAFTQPKEGELLSRKEDGTPYELSLTDASSGALPLRNLFPELDPNGHS